MANKQGKQPRRIPQWYLDKVNLAAEVFANAPQRVIRDMPYVADNGYGRGIQSYRRGYAASFHPPALATPVNLGTEGTEG